MAYDPKAFSDEAKRKKQAQLIRQTAAAEMATKSSPLDVIGDLAPYAGAAIGGFFGGPAGAQAGYQGGKALGGLVSGGKERKEAAYKEAMGEQPSTPEEKESGMEGVTGAVSKIKKMKDADQKAEAPVSGFGITPDEIANQAQASGFSPEEVLQLLKYAGS